MGVSVEARPAVALPAVAEDLLQGARESLALAATHCGVGGQTDCLWYHSSLPTLRLLGVFDSPGCDDEFLLPAFAAEFARGARRVLVSGCADAAMLARVGACVPAGERVEIVVLDRCATPLELCRQHAARQGFAIETVRSDVLDFEAAPFDLVCTHSFLCFFDSAGRAALGRRWHRLLAPGGAVVTAQRVRLGDPREEVRYDAAEARALAIEAARRAGLSAHETGIDAVQARELARAWTKDHFQYVLHSEAQLRAVFEAAGLALEHCAPPRQAGGLDRPGTPRHKAGSRWRIIARRPAEALA